MKSPNEFPDINYQLALISGLISIGALTVQICELVVHLSDEVKYLWRGRFNSVKLLYFCSRYVMLASQIVNQVLSYNITVRPVENMSNCSAIWVFKCVLGHLCLTVLEIILLLRVYALYNRNLKIKYFLAIVYLSAMGLEIAGNVLVIQNLLRDKGCHPPKLNMASLLMIGSGAGSIQLVIFALSLYKLVYDRQLSRTPLTSLMLREGVIVFLLLTAILMALLTNEMLPRRPDLGYNRAAFSCFLAIISMAASNLILNMRKLAIKNILRLQQPIGSQNMAEEAASGPYNIDQSICLTSFYE